MGRGGYPDYTEGENFLLEEWITDPNHSRLRAEKFCVHDMKELSTNLRLKTGVNRMPGALSNKLHKMQRAYFKGSEMKSNRCILRKTDKREEDIFEEFSEKARDLLSNYTERVMRARLGDCNPEVEKLKKYITDLESRLKKLEPVEEALMKMRQLEGYKVNIKLTK